MPNMVVRLQRTSSTTLDIGSILAAAASPRRFLLSDYNIGSEAAAGDAALLWEIYRRTGTATAGTAPSISPTNPADTLASTLVANQAPTVNGAGGTTNILDSVAMNQRSTYRWVAAPGSELVAPATASNGIGWATPTSTSLINVTVKALCNEQ